MLGFLRLVARLPLAALHRAGNWLGWLVFRLSPRYRTTLVGNLRQAGFAPGESEEGATLLREAVRQTGQMAAEMPFVWFRPLDQVLARATCDDTSALDQAESAGRGILFLTPHLGAFEVTARYYARRAPITVLFKPPKHPLLATVQHAARNFPGMTAVPVNVGGLRSLLRALRRGEAVGLLPDQVPGQGEGAWSPFFGRPAYTMTLPLRLAEQTGAAVVLAVGERLSRARGWKIHFEPLGEVPTPDAINRAMERLVRRLPAQYLWSYNRYKQPRGAPPPGVVDAQP